MAVNLANEIVEYGVWTAADFASDASGKKGIKKIFGSTNTTDADTDANLCVFCSGTNPLDAPVYVKNRLGQTCEIMIIIHGKRTSGAT